jgi:hypothetical protein
VQNGTDAGARPFYDPRVMLYAFIAVNRDDIIRRCRAKVARRSDPPPTPAEIDHGIPVFLDQLGDALRLGLSSSPEIGKSAVQHGHHLLQQGFTVSQVVHDYGDICQAITELAVELNAPISTDDFRTLNRCLNEAIAGAVTQCTRDRHQSDIEADMMHGNVGAAGSTGGVLYRSLTGLRALVERSLATASRIASRSWYPNSSTKSPRPRRWTRTPEASD